MTHLILFIGSLELTQNSLLTFSSEIPLKPAASYFLEKLLLSKGIIWGTPLLQVHTSSFLYADRYVFFFLAFID